jgi:hypothetical protein
MKRLRNFMLRLIGMYIPFVIVILGISSCSYIYKDELFGRFGSQEEIIEEVPVEEITPIEEETVDAVEMESEKEPLSTDGLPAINECFCPERSAGDLED